MANLYYAAASDIGFADVESHVNEDFVHVKEFETNEGVVTFGVVADGAGSTTDGNRFQPAVLAAIQVEEAVERLCKNNVSEFLSCPQVFMQEAMVGASYTLGAFRMANEQRYSGFATSMSCVLIYENGTKFAFAHTGNTRINIIRANKKNDGAFDVRLLTKDQTKGWEEVEKKNLTFAEYHLHPSRLEVTGGLGLSVTPTIQTFSATLKENDFILMTSDGIHNAIRPDVMFELLKKCENCEEVVQSLIRSAKIEQYEDNMAAVLFWNAPAVQQGGVSDES